MTAPVVDAPPVTDEEIREWARSTNRKVGERGRVPDSLKAEYAAELAELHGDQAGEQPSAVSPGAAVSPPPAAPAGGPQTAAARPRPAAQERRPAKVPAPRSGWTGRARAWFNGTPQAAPASKPRAAAPARPRMPVTRLIEHGWDRIAGVIEHVNVPVARCMAWQAPYVGLVADDIIKTAPAVDRVLQVAARAETALSGAGAMVAMPIVVGLITSPRNDPAVHGLPAVARQQALTALLEECIDSQLEMFGSHHLAERIIKSSEEKKQRRTDIDTILAMIFAAQPRPVVVDPGASEAQYEAAQQQARRQAEAEQQMREAAAAIRFMPPPEPDRRGDASERVAASTAASAAAAVAAQDAAVAAARAPAA